MNEYREKVRRLAEARTGEPFFNGSEEHATAIAENMFRVANSEVCIFTSHLAPRIYGRSPVVEWAEIFVADDTAHKVRVIVRNGDLELLSDNPLFQEIGSSSNFELKALPDEYHDEIDSSFMVADEDCYRFEPDKTKCEAVAAFGSEKAQDLKKIFGHLWTMADAVDLDNLVALEKELPLTD